MGRSRGIELAVGRFNVRTLDSSGKNCIDRSEVIRDVLYARSQAVALYVSKPLDVVRTVH